MGKKKQKKSMAEQVVKAEAMGPESVDMTNTIAPVGDAIEMARETEAVGKKKRKKGKK